MKLKASILSICLLGQITIMAQDYVISSFGSDAFGYIRIYDDVIAVSNNILDEGKIYIFEKQADQWELTYFLEGTEDASIGGCLDNGKKRL